MTHEHAIHRPWVKARVSQGAREAARRLCALFQHDRQLVQGLNAAQQRLAVATERLIVGLPPEALRAILGPGGPDLALQARRPAVLEDEHPVSALEDVGSAIRAAFVDYENIAERRRRLAVEVGEETVALVRELAVVGWREHEARAADVWRLAGIPAGRRAMRGGSPLRRLSVAVAALALAALAVTLLEGTPGRVPGIALGSRVLLHAERAIALFAVAIATLTVLAQASRGRLPTDLSTSGLRYEAEAADDAAAAVSRLQEQLDDLSETVAVLAEHLDAFGRRP
jgi:hypothetical protein